MAIESGGTVQRVVCPRCGSDAVNIQVILENRGSASIGTTAYHVKAQHGCFWWVLIGWWWTIIKLPFLVLALPFKMMGAAFKRRQTVETSTTGGVSFARNVQRKICVCQMCWNSWRI